MPTLPPPHQRISDRLGYNFSHPSALERLPTNVRFSPKRSFALSSPNDRIAPKADMLGTDFLQRADRLSVFDFSGPSGLRRIACSPHGLYPLIGTVSLRGMMRRTGLFVLSLFLVAPFIARAQDASDDVIMLPCDGKCATITRPLKKISGDALPGLAPGLGGALTRYRGHDPEGVVEVQFTIRPDGHVADDVSVIRAMGPREFVEATKRTVRTYVYEPAMVDGQAVAISHRLWAFFAVSRETGIRGSVVNGYRDASELMKIGKLDEAHAKLTEMLNLPSLNFFERGTIIYPLVLIAMQRQRYVEANDLSALALAFGPENLKEETYRSLIRFNISSALAMGDVVGAAKTLGFHKKSRVLGPADPIINEVAEFQKKLDALPSYSVGARIPDAADGDGFSMYLYRRNFAITKINGKLDRFTTNCREQQVESTISDKAEWNVPKNWSDCSIFVRGTPGTTFQIVQFSSPPPASR